MILSISTIFAEQENVILKFHLLPSTPWFYQQLTGCFKKISPSYKQLRLEAVDALWEVSSGSHLNSMPRPFKWWEFHSWAVRGCRDVAISNRVHLFETCCTMSKGALLKKCGDVGMYTNPWVIQTNRFPELDLNAQNLGLTWSDPKWLPWHRTTKAPNYVY